MVNYACGFSQSEMEKYFEWIIIEFNKNQNYCRKRNEYKNKPLIELVDDC